jgi:hypothetical protein
MEQFDMSIPIEKFLYYKWSENLSVFQIFYPPRLSFYLTINDVEHRVFFSFPCFFRGTMRIGLEGEGGPYDVSLYVPYDFSVDNVCVYVDNRPVSSWVESLNDCRYHCIHSTVILGSQHELKYTGLFLKSRARLPSAVIISLTVCGTILVALLWQKIHAR